MREREEKEREEAAAVRSFPLPHYLIVGRIGWRVVWER
jgi:hypothetical protein